MSFIRQVQILILKEEFSLNLWINLALSKHSVYLHSQTVDRRAWNLGVIQWSWRDRQRNFFSIADAIWAIDVPPACRRLPFQGAVAQIPSVFLCLKMKYALFLLLFVISCGDMRDQSQRTANTLKESSGNLSSFPPGFQLIELDSCQYVGYMVGQREGFFTHKGNCKFCEQRKCR